MTTKNEEFKLLTNELKTYSHSNSNNDKPLVNLQCPSQKRNFKDIIINYLDIQFFPNSDLLNEYFKTDFQDYINSIPGKPFIKEEFYEDIKELNRKFCELKKTVSNPKILVEVSKLTKLS